MNVTLELLRTALTLIANVNESSVQSLQVILQRTTLIDVITKAA